MTDSAADRVEQAHGRADSPCGHAWCRCCAAVLRRRLAGAAPGAAAGRWQKSSYAPAVGQALHHFRRAPREKRGSA